MQAVGPAPVLTHHSSHSSKQEPLNFSRFGDVLNKVNYIFICYKVSSTLSVWALRAEVLY